MLPFTEKHVLKSTPSSAMQPVFWKGLSALLVLCLLLQQFTWRSSTLPGPVFKHNFNHASEAAGQSWTYDWERDGNDHGLSAEQCDVAFPELYSEIDRAAAHWEGREITSKDIELYKANDGGVRILIADQQLRVIRTKGLGRNDFRHRIIAVLQQLQRSLIAAEHSGEVIPDMEFTVVVDDKPILSDESSQPGALWAFTRAYANPRHDNIWLVPDFHFWAAPPEAEAWKITQDMARRHDLPLHEKLPQVVWRGVKWTNEDLREGLITSTEGKPWANVKYINWKEPHDRMPMDDFCRYRYTINTEGRSWSARLTNLLNCDSLLIVHDVEWIAHYYHLLDTDVNCIRVERDFTDLEEKVDYYNNHTAEAQLIADAGRVTFRERYTTPAATACYWRKLMRSWASVAFKPEIMSTESGKDDKFHHSTSGLRGISFEEFIVHDNTRDYPYHLGQNHHGNEKPKHHMHPRPTGKP